MSSSLKNAVKRKTHKERAQPAGRKKLGLLEKKKDYRLRAADFARKKAHLESLRLKAELRNEDEFYFGMVKAQTKNGVHKVHREGPESTAVKLAERFDKAYLQAKLAHEKNLMGKLQSSLHLIGIHDESSAPKLTLFIEESEDDTDDDAKADQFDENILAELPAHLQPSETTLSGSRKVSSLPEAKMAKSTEKAYAELIRRQKRVDLLQHAIDHLDLKKSLSTKGKRRKVADAEGDRPAKYVWSSERAR